MDLYGNNIDQLLQARSEIDEELRRHKTQVTIFFTDVVGSTTYFDRFGDTAGLLLLHRHDSLVTSAVEEFHGMVVKKIGDSVMAEFPEPVYAVRAAIAIQRRLCEQNQNAADSERLRIRTGIHYGPGFRRGNDLFGDTINLAARITKRSGPSQILISQAVRETLPESEFHCKSIGGVSLDGKAEIEELHEVVWTDAASPIPSEFRPISLYDFSPEEQAEAPDLPRYEILAHAGVGATGLLFKARDRETGEIVALKVLKAEIADQPVLIDAFKNELRLARKITHKNVCRIYDFNRVDGVSFISMEFVEGESLRRVLNRFNALSTRTGVKIANQICEGLREAHAQGIVHRDLKPENLMIDASGNVKLMDFGLAHLVAEGSTAAVGTPSYMAPEQAQGAPIDQRCDIYALGLVLFEMFTGTSAFTGETPMVVALKHIQDAPQNPRDIEHTIPEHIAKAILRCLEKDPEKRFQSVDQLQAVMSDDSHSVEKTSRMRKDTPWAARAAVGLATVVAGFITVGFILLGRGSAPKFSPDSPPSAAEFSAFHMAESINTEDAWNTFLKNYKKGELAAVARERVHRLKASALQAKAADTTLKTKAADTALKMDVSLAAPEKFADAPTALKWSGLADMVQMPAGAFMMGKDNGKRDEKPRHQVQLDTFRISRSEVSNRLYLAFLTDTGYPRPKDPAFAKSYLTAYPDLPVVNVSYEDALAFCKWASTKFGVSMRLPTEAEWEYAEQKQSAHSSDWEWVADFYSKDYYSTSPVKNPTGPASGGKRVVRGQDQSRSSRDPKDRSDKLGFRVVLGFPVTAMK
jgi:serine/threonine protein kinase/class 3 adenylate cyclase/formylglycine-generating enzyme required for sulfatase activity